MVVVDGKPVPNGHYTPQRESIPKDIHRHINGIIHQSSVKQTELQNHSSERETDPARNNGLPSPIDGTTHSRSDQDRTDMKQAQRSELGWQTITSRVGVVPNTLDGIRHVQASKQAQWTELGRSWVRATDLSVVRRNGSHQRGEESRQAQRTELGKPPAGTFQSLTNGVHHEPDQGRKVQWSKLGDAESDSSSVATDGPRHQKGNTMSSHSRQAQRTELGTPPVGAFQSLTNGITTDHGTEQPAAVTSGAYQGQGTTISSISRQAQRTELGSPPAGAFQSLTNGVKTEREQHKQAQWTELGKHRSLEAANGIPPPVDGTRHTAGLNDHKISSNGVNSPTPKKKKLILNAFVEMCSGHQSPGLFRHPDDRSSDFNNITHWTNLAQLLEQGSFQGIFIADVLGGYDVYGGPKNLAPAIRSGAQWPVNEPLSVVPAMAAATKSIGFGVTISTSYEQPYHLARRMSTVDHLTNGRVGWNVVTGYLDSAARNLTNGNPQASHDDRYAIAEEYMDVVYKLWNSSWRSDAVKLDRKAGIYTDPELVREINHSGKNFHVPGPHFCAPSPQRTPVIMQAGTSRAGKKFASKHAEAIFVSAHSPISVANSIQSIRTSASQLGRDPNQIKFLAKFCPILGRTQEEAEAKYRDYIQYGSYEGALALFGGWTGVDMAPYGEDEELRYVESNAIRSYIEGLLKSAPDVNGGKWTKRTLAQHIMVGGLGATCVGTAEKVADEMERWVREGGVDGFNIAYALMPQTFEDVIEFLIPELRKRGLFWDGYCVPGGTYRENLYEMPGQHEPFPDHPAAKMIWRPDTLHVKKDATVNGRAAHHPKSVGFQLNGNAFTADAKGRLDFEEMLKQDDLIDAAAMQLG